MPAPQSVIDLVQRFESQLAVYKSGRYNETELRRDFLDPFFEALGWDVRNIANASERYRDVIHEQSVEVGGQAKSADYLFKIGADAIFFVEAKKPSVNIETDPAPAFQLKSYAWSRKLPFSILSDFEQMAFYECNARPVYTDLPSLGRVALYSFRDYVSKWDEIAARISRTAVTGGAFETYVQGVKGKRGTTDVDDAFLAEMERWRDLLAHNVALRNPALSQRELNFAVQTTIDRIIFLRICEDRGIEPDETLRNATDGIDVYGDLLELFRRADRKYNSGLFHFEGEKGRPGYPDALTPSLKIDDKVLKDILANLYLPKSPYRFNYFSADILGQVYERFLGKVIRLTAGHLAKVEDKPEVRKAGGVYYTPTYIVEYIVRNTVGELLKDKTPDSLRTTPLRVLDPACGSGSFLLGAYQYLLDWYLDWYIRNEPARHARGAHPAVIQNLSGWQLTLEKKKEILTSHIFGVDIDPQAVEVTKLSLLLKVVENPGQLSLMEERLLPDLGANIQCGNSLIGPDYFEGRLTIDDDEFKHVNPFDWQRAFPQVFAQGGFDAVIGNPPYVRQETLGNDKKYFQLKYRVYTGTADLYSYFIEKGISLLARHGQFSFIVANKWMRANYGEALRRWLKTKCIEELTDFGDLPVFENATTYPCIIRVANKPPHNQPLVTNVKTLEFPSLPEYVAANGTRQEQAKFNDEGWSLVDSKVQALLDKIKENSIPLEKYVNGKIYRGVLTGLNEAFVIDAATRERLITEDPKSAEIIKPFLIGRDVKRYQAPDSKRYLILIPKGWTKRTSKGTGNAWKWFATAYPAVSNHLEPFKDAADKRFDKGDYWWELRACDYYAEFEKPKIIIPSIIQKASYYFDEHEGYYSNDKTSIIPLNDLFLFGLLNSKVPDFFMHQISSTKQGGYFEYKPMYISQIPIRKFDLSKNADNEQYNRMVSLVRHMINLHKRAPASPQEQEQLAREIAATDNQIDALVYQLYGLTPEEIAIVESA